MVFIDSSHTDVYGKNKIEPVQFTLSIFKRECQRNFNFCHPLGFINDLSYTKLFTHVRKNGVIVNHGKVDAPTNTRDYHRILSVIFKSLKDVQDMGGFHFRLYYKHKFHDMIMKPGRPNDR